MMAQDSKIIVGIHGAGAHGGIFDALAVHVRLPFHALTLPGHGDGAGELLPTIEDMGAWVRARLDVFAPRRIVLLGHSMGALAALEAASHPSVDAVVLLGAAARMPVHPDLLAEARANPVAATDMILKWGVSPAHPEAMAVRSALRHMMNAPAGVLHNDLLACDVYTQGDARAREIALPALIIAGVDDKLAKPAASQALGDMMPHAQVARMEACGHMPMTEKPLETADIINAFAKTIQG